MITSWGMLDVCIPSSQPRQTQSNTRNQPAIFSGGCVFDLGQEENCCRVQSSDQINYCCRIEAIAPQSPRRGSDKQGRCLRAKEENSSK